MIARVWKGWTKTDDADAYEKLLREVVYPGLQTLKGYLGGYILRHDGKNETEFVAVNFFESLDAVKAFAGLTMMCRCSSRKRDACFPRLSRLPVTMMSEKLRSSNPQGNRPLTPALNCRG